MKGLSVFKNILWAMCIFACLIALLVGFFAAAFTRYTPPVAVEGAEPTPGIPTGTLNQLGETADGGQAYLDSLTFLCDSTLIGLRDFGLVSDSSRVWGSSAGNIPVKDMADPSVRMADGSEKTVSQAVAEFKPSVLVISLGMDSLKELDRTQFEANYTSLVQRIQAASPGTKIVLCGLSSVTTGYSGSDGLTVELVGSAEGWVQNVCRDTGVYYAAVTENIRDTTGTLFADYAGVNGKALNSAGVSKVLEYLRSHTVP